MTGPGTSRHGSRTVALSRVRVADSESTHAVVRETAICSLLSNIRCGGPRDLSVIGLLKAVSIGVVKGSAEGGQGQGECACRHPGGEHQQWPGDGVAVEVEQVADGGTAAVIASAANGARWRTRAGRGR